MLYVFNSFLRHSPRHVPEGNLVCIYLYIYVSKLDYTELLSIGRRIDTETKKMTREKYKKSVESKETKKMKLTKRKCKKKCGRKSRKDGTVPQEIDGGGVQLGVS